MGTFFKFADTFTKCPGPWYHGKNKRYKSRVFGVAMAFLPGKHAFEQSECPVNHSSRSISTYTLNNKYIYLQCKIRPVYMNFRQNFSQKIIYFRHFRKNFSRDCSLHTQRLTQRKPLSWTFCSTLIYVFIELWRKKSLARGTTWFTANSASIHHVCLSPGTWPGFANSLVVSNSKRKKSGASWASLFCVNLWPILPFKSSRPAVGSRGTCPWVGRSLETASWKGSLPNLPPAKAIFQLLLQRVLVLREFQ